MSDADDDISAFDLPDPDHFCRDSLRPCGMLGIKPLSPDRAQTLGAEWSDVSSPAGSARHSCIGVSG